MAHEWGNWKPNEKIYTKDLQAIEDKIAKLPTREEVEKFEKLENKLYLRDYSFFYKGHIGGYWTYSTDLPKNNNEKYLNSGSIKTIIDCIKDSIKLGEFEIVNNIYEKIFYNGDKIDINEILCDWEWYRRNKTVNGSIENDTYPDSASSRNFFISKLTQTNSSGQEVTVTTAQLKNPTSLSEQQEFNVYLVNPFTGEEVKTNNKLTITIKHQPPASISVTKNPKTTYNNQEYFDPTGIEVTAYDSSGNLYITSGTPNGKVPTNELSYNVNQLLAYTNSNRTVTLNVTWNTFNLSTSGPILTIQPTNPHHMIIEAQNINYNDGDNIIDSSKNHIYVGIMVNSDGSYYGNEDYSGGVTVNVSTSTTKAQLNDSSVDYGEAGTQTIVFTGTYNNINYNTNIAINVYKVIPKFSDLTVEELSDIINKYKAGFITKEQLQHWTTNLADVKRIDISSNEYFNTKLYLSVAAIKDESSPPNYTVGNNEKYMIILMSIYTIKSFYDSSEGTYHWENSYIREHLNVDLYQSLPDGYKALFKKFKHYIYDWSDGYGGFIEDTFSSFSMGEVNGRDGDCKSKTLISSQGGFGPERANQDPELRDYFERGSFYVRTLTKYSNEECYTFRFSGNRTKYEESLWHPMYELSSNINFYGVM